MTIKEPRSPESVLAEQLRAIRERRRMTQQQVASAVTALGVPMTQATVAKTEGGTRRVSLAEALAFARALNVSPVHLMVPMNDAERSAITPESRSVRARDARRWVRGQAPLPGDDRAAYWQEVASGEFADQLAVDAEVLLDGVRNVVAAAVEMRNAAGDVAIAVAGEDRKTTAKALRELQAGATEMDEATAEIDAHMKQAEWAIRKRKGRKA